MDIISVINDNNRDSSQTIKINMVGDIMGARELACSEDQYNSHLDSISDVFIGADINICNLETVVSDNNILPSLKSRSNFKSSTLFIKSISRLFNVCLLANNHIGDFDSQGVQDTISTLEKNGIAWTGINKRENGEKIARHLTMEIKNTKICILNYSLLNVPKIYGYNINVFSRKKFLSDIKDCLKISKIILVSLHGGRENIEFVEPQLRKASKFAIDNGASLVFGHHTHVLSGYEIYKSKPIFYSLGNFIFDNPINYKRNYSGVLSTELDLSGNILSFSFKPLLINREYFPTICPKIEQEIINNVLYLSDVLITNKNDDYFWAEAAKSFGKNSKDNLQDAYKKMGFKGILYYIKRIRFKHLILLFFMVFKRGGRNGH